MVSSKLVFYTATLAFLLGVFIRSFVPVLGLSLYSLWCLVGIFLILIWWQSIVRRSGWTKYGLLFLIAIVACLLGVIRFSHMDAALNETVLKEEVGKKITITGVVVSEPDRREATTLLTVATDDTKVLVSTDRATPVLYGDSVLVTGTLVEPQAFATDLGRTFDYPGYLKARGITHTMSFTTPIVLDTRQGWPLLDLLYAGKDEYLLAIEKVIPEPEASLGAGLLLGVKGGLGETLEADFRTTGIVHIIVLSGYNIMLVVTFVLYVSAYLLPWRWRFIACAGAVIIFALLVGYSPSVMRASVMALLFLWASLSARQYILMRALLAAAAFMVLVNPFILRYDVGFQLSCMATLGLMVIAPYLDRLLARATLFSMIKTIVVATIATQIAVAPLLLYHIGEWSLVAIPVNVLVLPVVAGAMLFTALTGLIALISPSLALPVGFLAYLMLSYIIVVATTAADLPFASVSFLPLPAWFVFIAYGFLGYLWYWGSCHKKSVATLPKDLLYKTADDIAMTYTMVNEDDLRKM